jgi:hypothetical protein
MFEKASRLRIRFDSPKGLLSVEDVWQLPLSSTTGRANLDDIAKDLNQLIQHQNIGSFVNLTAAADALIQLKFDIVLHIIKVRMAENEAVRLAVTKSEQKQKLLGLIAQKQDEALGSKSVEELLAMVNSL